MTTYITHENLTDRFNFQGLHLLDIFWLKTVFVNYLKPGYYMHVIY